jgi:hypothetical protein
MHDRKRLTTLRTTIAQLQAERREIERAPVPLEQAVAAMRQRVEALARGYVPQLGGFMTHVEGAPADIIEPGGRDLEAFLAWLNPEQLAARLEAALRAQYAGVPLALSPGERAERLADVDARLLKLEREEEDLVRKLEGEGLDVDRRADASVEVLLDVR